MANRNESTNQRISTFALRPLIAFLSTRQIAADISTRRGQDLDPRYHDWDKETPYKVLLLGVEGSGKTTIVNQMKIVYRDGFDWEELKSYRDVITRLLFDALQEINEYALDEDELVQELLDSLPSHFNWERLMTAIDTSHYSNGDFSSDLLTIMDDKPSAKTIIRVILKVMERVIPASLDSTAYFVQEMPHIISPTYLPSDADILHTKFMTTGIVETMLLIENFPIRVVDTGGTRPERRKWINYYGSVSTLVFCVPLGDYNRSWEHGSASAEENQVAESLRVFEDTLAEQWLRHSQIILFFTKVDLLEEQLQTDPLENYFPDYNGGPDIDEAMNYFFWKFLRIGSISPGMQVEVYVTEPINTMRMTAIFEEVINKKGNFAKARKTTPIPSATLPLHLLPRCTILHSGRITIHDASVFVSGAYNIQSSLETYNLQSTLSLDSFSSVAYSVASSRTQSTDYGHYARRLAPSQETLEFELENDTISIMTVT
ncbi:G-protein alpha subunit-domain-containing protein, partial [Gymnopilus junonius]